MSAKNPRQPSCIEEQIFDLLASHFDDPDPGHQEQALSAAVGKLVGLAHEMRAQRTLRRWHSEGDAFGRAVKRTLEKVRP